MNGTLLLTAAPDANARDFLTLRMTSRGIAALVFPPTVRLGPNIAPYWLALGGLVEAALAEERMSPSRREFVAARLPYWDSWARGPHGVISMGDRE